SEFIRREKRPESIPSRLCDMNRSHRTAIAIAAIIGFLASALFPASLPGASWWEHRLYPESVQVREIQGVTDRIVDGKLHLTLKAFLELVLKNSTDINITRLDVFTAATQIQAAKAPFDPFGSAGFSTLRSVQPSSSQISGATTLSTLTQNSSLSYQQLLPTGTNLSAQYQASRSSNNSAFSLLNPDIFSNFSFSATQPLLQDRSRIQFRGPMTIARTQLEITSRQSEAHIADLIATAAVEYWSAVQARDNVKVLQQTL